jgi:hypothetical protein
MEGDVTVSFCFAADRLSLCGRLCRPFLPPSADLGRRSVTFSARFEGDEGGVEAKRSEAKRSGAERSAVWSPAAEGSALVGFAAWRLARETST